MSDDFWRFLTPHPPITSDFYLLMSDFLGSFQTPYPPLKSDIINRCSIRHSFGAYLVIYYLACGHALFSILIDFLFVLQVSIITSGYDTIQRTQLVIHIYTKKLTFVCKDGRVLHFSHEPQELRDFILCQISQHQVRIRICSNFQIWNCLWLLIKNGLHFFFM